jgi:hypothetical protein
LKGNKYKKKGKEGRNEVKKLEERTEIMIRKQREHVIKKCLPGVCCCEDGGEQEVETVPPSHRQMLGLMHRPEAPHDREQIAANAMNTQK